MKTETESWEFSLVDSTSIYSTFYPTCPYLNINFRVFWLDFLGGFYNKNKSTVDNDKLKLMISFIMIMPHACKKYFIIKTH